MSDLSKGMTAEQFEERERKRRVLMNSVLMESSFCANDVARLLSDHKNGKPVSKDNAKEFLGSMERDGLIRRLNTYGQARWCRKCVSLAAGRWRSTDNGVRLGMHLPC